MDDRRPHGRLLGRGVAVLAGVLLVALPVVLLGLRAPAPPPPAADPPGPGTAAGTHRSAGEPAVAPAVTDGLPAAPPPVARAGEDGLDLSWALVDTASGRWTGSADAATERTEAESTIKAWLAADTLRAAAENGRPPTGGERRAIADAVRDSDDDAAERLYRALGTDSSLRRLDDVCEVDVSTSRPGWWSFTQVSAVDAARILGCVRERAPEWPGGADLLADLASISPDGRSGVDAQLPGPVAEKNGWTLHGDTWNVNCVLAWDESALAVLLSYPAGRGVDYGWGVCRDVAGDVLAEAG